MCLLQLQKEQLDKKRKITVLKNSLKNVFYFVVLKQKKHVFLKKTCFKTSSHLYRNWCITTSCHFNSYTAADIG